MAQVPMWRRYLCFWGQNLRADVETELQVHLDMLTEQYVAEGMPPADARAQARRRFGDVHRVRTECLQVDQRWETQKLRLGATWCMRWDRTYGSGRACWRRAGPPPPSRFVDPLVELPTRVINRNSGHRVLERWLCRTFSHDLGTAVLRSSRRATARRWTSSGPSPRRSVRVWAHARVSPKSSQTPPPPYTWMARSITLRAMAGATTLIIVSSARAALLDDRKYWRPRGRNASY